jgi:hypothetical protein
LTGNLWKHAESCCGELAVRRAKELSKLDDVIEGIVKPLQKYGTLPTAFDVQGQGIMEL